MTDRIAGEWQENLEDAFGVGDAVRKGKEAEDLYYAFAREIYDKVEYHETERDLQNAGCDFTIYKAKWKEGHYTVDVKAGLMYKTILLDNRPNGWLRSATKTSSRIVHIDVKRGWAADYRREDMIALAERAGLPPEDGLELDLEDPDVKAIVKSYKVSRKRTKSYFEKMRAKVAREKSEEGIDNVTSVGEHSEGFGG